MEMLVEVEVEEVGDGEGWKIKQWGIVVGVKRVVAINESSEEGLGVRERGSAVMVEGVRREDVQGMLAK